MTRTIIGKFDYEGDTARIEGDSVPSRKMIAKVVSYVAMRGNKTSTSLKGKNVVAQIIEEGEFSGWIEHVQELPLDQKKPATEPTKEELDRSREEYNATAAKMAKAGFGQPTPGPAPDTHKEVLPAGTTLKGVFKNINKFNQIGIEVNKRIHMMSVTPELLMQEKENFGKNGGFPATITAVNGHATGIVWGQQEHTEPPKQEKEAPKEVPAKSEKDVWGEEYKRFHDLLGSVNRPGIPEFLQYLEKETDFFIAPSSTHYHDARDGGLLHHSLSVYDNLTALSQIYAIEIPEESRIIIGLLHDICKMNFYRKEKKSLPRKDEKGEIVLDDWGRKIWDETLVWTIDDQLPLGHGEKSVILILQHGLKLTDEEIAAIRWHMMAYDDVKGSYAGNLAITNASDKWRIIPLVHMADLAASFLEMRVLEETNTGGA